MQHVAQMDETLSVFKEPPDVDLTHLDLPKGLFVSLLDLEPSLELFLASNGRLTRERHLFFAHG